MGLVFNPGTLKKAERWVIVLVALTVVVTLAVTLLAGKKSLVQHLNDLPWHAVGWLLLATMVESALRTWRYHIAGQVLHLGVPWQRMVYYYTVGYALIPTPGKVGTAIRLWLLKKYHHLPYRRTAPLLVMDLVSDSIAMCTLAALALAIIDNPALNTLGWLIGTALVAGTVLVLAAPYVLRRVFKTLHALTGRRHRRKFARLQGLMHTARNVLGLQTLLTTTMLSMAGWGIVGVAIGYFITQLGTPLGAAEGILSITLATMGGFLTMMPAGVGGAEVTMAGVFTLFGVPLVEAVLATAVVRLIVLWLTVAVGLVLLPIALRNAPHS